MTYQSIPIPQVTNMHVVPPEAHGFLYTCGWASWGPDPTTNEMLYTNYSHTGMHFRWYEAVALEYIRMAQLGLR